MKNVLSLAIILFLITGMAFSQNVGINEDGSEPDSTAMLHVKSTSKGFLCPRMTTEQREGILDPAFGLLVFDTDESAFYYYDNSNWVNVSSGTTFSKSGNNLYLEDGNVGIGTSNPEVKLHLVGGNHDLLKLQDTTEGLGNQVGILFTTFIGNNEAIARIAAEDRDNWNGALIFETDNDNIQNSNLQERMRITEDGNVGIGTEYPEQMLHLNKSGDFGYIQVEVQDDYDAGLKVKANSVGGESGNVNQYAVFINGQDNTGDFTINEDYISGVWNPTTRFLIENETGHVGIGTAEPEANMHIKDDDFSYYLVEVDDDTDAGIAFVANSVGSETGGVNKYAVFINGQDNSGDFTINEDYIGGVLNPTTRFVVQNETGNIGIGESNPVRKLHVSDAMRLTPLSAVPSSPATGDLYMDDGTNTGGTAALRYYNGTDWMNLVGASTPVYGFAKVSTAGTATSAETNFGNHTSAVVSTTVSSGGITWDGTNKEFDITTAGVYEVNVCGTFADDTYDAAIIKIYVAGVEKNSIDILGIYNDAGNPFSISWLGSVGSSESIKVTIQGTSNVVFDPGSTVSVKKID